MELMQAHHQWLKRPADERFTSLDALFDHTRERMEHSRELEIPSREIKFEPADDNKGVVMVGATNKFAPTHWAFSQACGLVKAPADYFRDSLPSPMVADCLNWNYLQRPISDVKPLIYQNGGAPELSAINGPGYGRVWDAEYVDAIRKTFDPDRWHIPYEFNQKAEVNKQNTTLYSGDRDTWIFLCDGANDMEIKNRRDGKSGRLQRGFFSWNSQVGARSLGGDFFLFDYMCGNHIVWSASGLETVRIRHTASAPLKWAEELLPALKAYAESETSSITKAIAAAQEKRLADKTDEFLANRFGPRMAQRMKLQHEAEEGRPIETVFDAVTAATAVARGMPWIGPRVDLEREAGALLKIAA